MSVFVCSLLCVCIVLHVGSVPLLRPTLPNLNFNARRKRLGGTVVAVSLLCFHAPQGGNGANQAPVENNSIPH
jgi:hypothetical protein